MPFLPKLEKRLYRRLLPLYVAAFFQGFVLWYTIEKLFMRSIGFDDAGIGIMVAGYSVVMLLIETPSGILADRWSRKGVLMVASVALAASSLVCGISDSIPFYLVGAGLWGIFFAFYSGTYDSMVYDTLLEETKNSEAYELYYGRIKLVESAALVMGSLAGGVIAGVWGLREVYFYTVPLALVALVALWQFKEPVLHKTHLATPIQEHVRQTFQAVLQKGRLLPVLVVLVTVSALSYILFEFSQLWLIALALPAVVFGPANALLLSTIGLGGLVAGYKRVQDRTWMHLLLALMLAATVGLALFRDPWLIVLCQVVLGIGVMTVTVLFNRLLHDSLPSKVRAGAASAASTLTRMVMIPLALLFGFVSRAVDTFAAAWILSVAVVVVAVFATKVYASRRTVSPGLSGEDDLTIEQQYQK